MRAGSGHGDKKEIGNALRRAFGNEKVSEDKYNFKKECDELLSRAHRILKNTGVYDTDTLRSADAQEYANLIEQALLKKYLQLMNEEALYILHRKIEEEKLRELLTDVHSFYFTSSNEDFKKGLLESAAIKSEASGDMIDHFRHFINRIEDKDLMNLVAREYGLAFKYFSMAAKEMKDIGDYKMAHKYLVMAENAKDKITRIDRDAQKP